MFDSVVPDVVPDAQPNICPNCATEFQPKRSNQKYCRDACRKTASHNTARSDRTTEYAERSELHYERAGRLAEMVYFAAPGQRLGVMKHILSFVAIDAGLRNILADPKLLKEPPCKSGRKNIAQAANAYTQKFFGVSIKGYLTCIREGTLNENHPVRREVDFGSVPRLTKFRRVRCWHRALLNVVNKDAQERFANGMARVSNSVIAAQGQVDALCRNLICVATNF